MIAELDDVAECCTVGMPDSIYGEKVVSFVALKPGSVLTEEQILGHCAARLPPFKTPTRVILRNSLPRTARGKLDRKALTANWSEI